MQVYIQHGRTISPIFKYKWMIWNVYLLQVAYNGDTIAVQSYGKVSKLIHLYKFNCDINLKRLCVLDGI